MNQITDVAAEMMAYYQETASRRGNGGWRDVGAKIGCSGAYARQIAMRRKPVTPDIAGDWLVSMGWKPKLYQVEACPDCAGVHTGRCNGKPVAEVVVKTKRTPPPPWVAQAVLNLELCLERKHARASS